MRDAAIDALCGTDAAVMACLLAELAAFVAVERTATCRAQSQELHPVVLWRLWGYQYDVLQPLAVRLLSIPPSAAGGERIFKTIKGVLTSRRSRLGDGWMDRHACSSTLGS